MTSDPIDKVARAIDVAGTAWLNAPENAGGDDEPGKTWIDVPGRVLAIAALRAIREPTDEMVEAMASDIDRASGLAQCDSFTMGFQRLLHSPKPTPRSVVSASFQAAIDKLLETNPNTGREG